MISSIWFPCSPNFAEVNVEICSSRIDFRIRFNSHLRSLLRKQQGRYAWRVSDFYFYSMTNFSSKLNPSRCEHLDSSMSRMLGIMSSRQFTRLFHQRTVITLFRRKQADRDVARFRLCWRINHVTGARFDSSPVIWFFNNFHSFILANISFSLSSVIICEFLTRLRYLSKTKKLLLSIFRSEERNFISL